MDPNSDTSSLGETSTRTETFKQPEALAADPPELSPSPGEPYPINEVGPMEGLIEGRIVHYVLDNPLAAGEHPETRPAMIVAVWDRYSGVSNLQVASKGLRDAHLTGGTDANWVCKTSVRYSEGREPGTWHWIPRG